VEEFADQQSDHYGCEDNSLKTKRQRQNKGMSFSYEQR
jgi:hypothetical protein